MYPWRDRNEPLAAIRHVSNHEYHKCQLLSHRGEIQVYERIIKNATTHRLSLGVMMGNRKSCKGSVSQRLYTQRRPDQQIIPNVIPKNTILLPEGK